MSFLPSPGAPTPQYPATPRVLGLLVVAALLVVGQLYAALPLRIPVSHAFAADATFSLSTVFGVGYAAGFLVWGPLSEQFGRKRMLLFGLTVLVFATAACALAPSLIELGAARAVQGLAAACFAPIVLAYLSDAAPPPRRPLAISVMATSFLLAGVFGQVYAAALLTRFAWSGVFWVSTALLAATVVMIAVGIRDAAPAHRPETTLARRFRDSLALLVTRPVLLISGGHVTLMCVFTAFYAALIPVLQQHGAGETGMLWLRIAAIPGMFATLLVGPLAARLGGIARVARLGCLVSGGSLLAAPLVLGSPQLLAIAGCLMCAGVALSLPSGVMLYGDASPHARGIGMALNGFVLFLGASLGPLAALVPVSAPILLGCLAGVSLLGAASYTGFLRQTPYSDGPR
ncbi:MFS transporter [Leucobacter sp. 7(1)]|uniref:MFS transporter n=1 Tax=Leucobacter sp. 7(1) TaxID=1255613 RepID=UPI000B362B79|nr:MFS transporter [Leucobacter sp. 7(1)]